MTGYPTFEEALTELVKKQQQPQGNTATPQAAPNPWQVPEAYQERFNIWSQVATPAPTDMGSAKL